jgi:transposase
MIPYDTYCQILRLHRDHGLRFNQIAQQLGLHPGTVAKYAQLPAFPRRKTARRPSKLDPFKPLITAWLDRHPYTAAQIHQRLIAEAGYTGGYSILKDYLRQVRPPRREAFLSLAFAPGEAAQADWGSAGFLSLNHTRRRLSFFLMVLCHSRMAYLEFTCGESLEHFLHCQARAFEFFGGVPSAVIIDNLKTGVLRHPPGEKAVFHPRYLDFAAHYGFQPRACTVRRANEKGRVENGVGYVKKNFLAGLDSPPNLAALNTAARRWLDTVANVRLHRETRQEPRALFAAADQPALLPLPAEPADTSVTRTVRVSKRCRVTFDTNRYSVPSLYASQQLTLKAFAGRLCFYHAHNLIASHPRSYERHQDFVDPDHLQELLHQRRRARDTRELLAFYALSPRAELYCQQLSQRSLNARLHVRRIVALSAVHGPAAVASALEEAIACQAFSSQYIENILEQRSRFTPPPGPLHLTRRSELLDLDLSAPDLSPYDLP